MKRNTNIKEGYKKTAVGLIPKEWEVMPFNKCFKHLRAYTISRNQLDYEKNESSIYNIHYGDIHSTFPNNILDVKKYKKLIPIIANPEIDTPELLRDGDLIMADASEDYEGIGKAIELSNVKDKKIVSGTHTFPLRPITEFAPKYAGFIFSEFNIHKQIMRIATGISVYGISKGNISKVQLPIPPLPEQQAIANCLTTWDSGIEKLTQLIAAKREQKKGLMQQLLTGKKRLDGFVGEWKRVKIGSFSIEKTSKNVENKDIEVLSCTKYDGLVPSLEYFGRKVFGDDLSKYKVVPKGYFAYATNHIEEGSIGYQNIRDKGLVSPMYTVFKTNQEIINDVFLFMLLKSHKLIHEYNKRMEGSIDRRGGLRWKNFKSIKINIPSIKEQTAIAHILTTADQEIALLEKKLEAMKEEKKGLMQGLLTGEKRLVESC